MSELRDVDLIKPNIRRRTTERTGAKLHISGEEEDFLGQGAYGYVTRVNVPIKEGLSLGLAYKEISSEGRAADALRAWLRLKKAGVPVPRTFRLVEQNGRYTGILMSDLTNGWKDVFITSNPTKAMIIDRVNERFPSTVQGLASLDTKDSEYVEKLDNDIREIAEKTAKNKIRIEHSDVVSAVYRHNGDLNLIISDMDNVLVDRPESYDTLFANNLARALGVKLLINEANRLAKEIGGVNTTNK